MANKVYLQQETTITFKSSGGDVAFDPNGVADGAGWVSAQYDRGAAPKSGWYFWQAQLQTNGTTPVVGQAVRMYLARSHDGTDIDGDLGTSSTAVSDEDVLRNCNYIGSVTVENAAGQENLVSSGTVFIPTRYCSLVWWNDTGATITSTAADNEFYLIPIPDEIQ